MTVSVGMRWSGARSGQFGEEFVFRPRTGLLVCVLWSALTVLWVYMEARDGIGALVTRLPLIVLVGLAVVALFGRPCVIVDPAGVTLRNVIRDVRVPYGSLTEVTTRFSLVLQDRQGGRHSAWAAPAPGRFATRKAATDPRADAAPTAGTPSRSDAGSVARAITRIRLQRSDGSLSDQQQVRSRWAVEVLLPLAGAAVLAVVVPLLF